MRDMPDGSRQPSIIYNGFLGAETEEGPRKDGVPLHVFPVDTIAGTHEVCCDEMT